MNGRDDNRERKANTEDMAAVTLVQAETQAWIRQAQNGSAFAFEQLYRRHVGRVYAVCLRMTGNVATAEELTQETFVRAWEKLESFREESQFGTWLHRIAVNRVLDSLRSRKRRADREVLNSDTALPEDTSPSGGALEAAADVAPRDPGLRMDLEEAIASLPEGARAVFVLHDIEGYRHDEIAHLAGIAEGTSKAHLHRARKLLRERLKP